MLVMSVFIGTASGRILEQRFSECLQKSDVLETCSFPGNCKALLFLTWCRKEEFEIKQFSRIERYSLSGSKFLVEGVIIGVVETWENKYIVN